VGPYPVGAAVRSGWLAWSAASLVIGTAALTLAASVNPNPSGVDARQVLEVAMMPDSVYVGMAAALLLASIALMFGLPTLWAACGDRPGLLGVLAVSVYSLGVLGCAGYAVLLVFVRALAVANAFRPGGLERVINDDLVSVVLFGWVACFYLGGLLLALAMFRSRTLPAWVPGALVVSLALLPLASMLGRIGQVLQVLMLTMAFTGVATSVVQHDMRAAEPASAPHDSGGRD
jgi:hypothetical protein